MGYESNWDVDIDEIEQPSLTPFDYGSGNLPYQKLCAYDTFMDAWAEREPYLNSYLSNRCKWYDFDEHLLPLSTKHPTLLITVT